MRIQETFEQDKDKIANKYHKQGEPFDAYRRMAYHGYDFDETTGKSDKEIGGIACAERKNQRFAASRTKGARGGICAG